MPTLGGISTGGDGDKEYTTYFASEVTAQPPWAGAQDLYVTPIVPDYTQVVLSDLQPEDAPSLRDATEGQDWLLKRIVGKLHIAAGQLVPGALETTPKVLRVAAGFFVGRASEVSPDVPDMSNFEIDPFGLNNVRQPWIWRRNWWLFNGLAPDTAQSGIIGEVNNNLFSALDGPNIDSKVARRIRKEERLWFTLNAYGSDDFTRFPGVVYTNPGLVQFSLDYRILGAMRKSSSRSTF